MKKHFTRLTVLVLILSIFLQCAPIVSAAQEGESERNMSQSVTATVGSNTLHAITDPVVFWEVANGGSLVTPHVVKEITSTDENGRTVNISGRGKRNGHLYSLVSQHPNRQSGLLC